jgi:hypothetical protein
MKISPFELIIIPKRTGYCIRTGTKISFKPKQAFSMEAFRSWNESSLHGCSAAELCITLANKKAEAVKTRRKTELPNTLQFW